MHAKRLLMRFAVIGLSGGLALSHSASAWTLDPPMPAVDQEAFIHVSG